jgi:hypothetical protein
MALFGLCSEVLAPVLVAVTIILAIDIAIQDSTSSRLILGL